ncbi:MAG TPA: GNAT family N-acetyltransferase, partial [Dermatophilaceae bacterium]|nr:GNAT family N-acetyltransferase [Dermatophilaceae bacterium]
MPPAPPPTDPAPPVDVPDDLPGYPECVPVLTDDVITIGAHRPDDADRIVAQCASPAMQRWVPVPSPYLPEHATEFLTRVADGWRDPDGRREWAIRNQHGTYLGTIGLFDRSAGRCEVGFGLHPDARGVGVMSRAVRLLAAWAFAQGVEVVQWRAEVGNWSSRRVAWTCGFDTPVIVRGNGLDHAGRPRDMWHATLRHDEPMHPRAPWLHVPAVEGDRVRLREFREDDEGFLPDARDARAARFLTRGMPTHDR